MNEGDARGTKVWTGEREAAAAQSNLPSLLRQRAVRVRLLRLLAPLADNANFALRREGNRARRKSYCPPEKNWDGVSPPSSGEKQAIPRSG